MNNPKITETAWKLLIAVNPRRLCVARMARKIGIGYPVATIGYNRLEESGHFKKIKIDERSSYYNLTAKGERLRKALVEF